MVCFVQFKVEPNDLERFLATAREVMEATQPEQGRIVYRYGADIVDPTLFHITEVWESREALEAHTRTAHFAKAMSILPALAIIDPVETWTGPLVYERVQVRTD